MRQPRPEYVTSHLASDLETRMQGYHQNVPVTLLDYKPNLQPNLHSE